MDSWKAVMLVMAAGQGILLSLALMSPARNKDKSNIFLGLIIWVASLEMLVAWSLKEGHFASPAVFPYFLLGSYLLLPPAAWFFLQFNTKAGFQFRKEHWWFFAPALAETLLEFGFFLSYHYNGGFVISLGNIPWFVFVAVLPIAGMLLVLFLYGRRLLGITFQYKADTTSLQSPLRLARLYALFAVLSLSTLLWVAWVIFKLPIIEVLQFFLMSMLFVLGYLGYFKPAFFELPELQQQKAPEAASFPHYEDEKELMRLEQLFIQDRFFTRPKLSLEDLAEALKLPPRYLSYLINTYHASNFNNFINVYRVQEVIRKINNPAEQHKTLLALALESGFSSKSTFNHVFRKHTGQSPSQYLPVAGK